MILNVYLIISSLYLNRLSYFMTCYTFEKEFRLNIFMFICLSLIVHFVSALLYYFLAISVRECISISNKHQVKSKDVRLLAGENLAPSREGSCGGLY